MHNPRRDIYYTCICMQFHYNTSNYCLVSCIYVYASRNCGNAHMNIIIACITFTLQRLVKSAAGAGSANYLRACAEASDHEP